ncbi:MAG: BtpA/SgcQ family protein [Desulfurococcaceae archaeon]
MFELRRSDLEKLVPEWARRFYSKRMFSIRDLFRNDKAIIGMVHLLPLPGAPAYEGWSMDVVVEHAVREARTLEEHGVDGVIVENMWDLPYFSGASRIPPEEIAAHAVAAREVVKSVSVPVGITVIHNGGRVALGIAKAAGAKFIRVCLYTGAAVWDTGEFDHGNAAELMRLRKALYAEDIKFFADVVKKHSVMFPGIDYRTHATWADFYMADALIVTGRMTGEAPSPEDVKLVKEIVGDTPVLIGSGLTPENAEKLLRYADGAIVGTYFKVNGMTQNPLDPERIDRLMAVVRRIRSGG